MKIDFSRVEEQHIDGFKGGEGVFAPRMVADDLNKIMTATLAPGAFIGEHAHVGSSEIVFILEGEGVMVCDGVRETLRPGEASYCPEGHSHSLRNESGAPLRFFAVVPEHLVSREYYSAYDERYRTVHALGLQWASDVPTAIVGQVAEELSLSPAASVLELGCGEGRDAAALLRRGFDVTATDISPEAVAWCRSKYPEYAGHFAVLDCVKGGLAGKYDFIYAVAVLHMLTEDSDRAAFWRFVREHLTGAGRALVLTMGDGTVNRSSDPARAFDSAQRTHQATGRIVSVASTTCRTVDRDALRREVAGAGLELLREGSTACPPEFDVMMYALVGVK